MRRNHVELAGRVASPPDRRNTPAGNQLLSFRLKVEADPAEPATAGCMIPIVLVGADARSIPVEQGQEVVIEGALTERRWTGPGGSRQSRFEIVARKVAVIA